MRTLLRLLGLALVLASPAYGTETGLVLRSAGGQALVAPLVATDVVIHVAGPVARARVVQTFRNPQDDWYEGIYVFPLPENGAVDRLRLRVGERLIEGEIQERAAARRIYGEARASGRRAALLDQERPNIFTTQVANIGPGETVVIELEYQHVLRYDNGRFSLRFPMVVGPRYVPAGPMRVADADRIRQDLEARGIKVHCKAQTKAILGDERVEGRGVVDEPHLVAGVRPVEEAPCEVGHRVASGGAGDQRG